MCVNPERLGKLKARMSRRGVVTAAAVGAVGIAGAVTGLNLAPARAEPSASGGEAVTLTGVTVIDVTGSAPKPDMTLVIRDGRIAKLGKRGEVNIPRGARVVDMTGKFVIPGLCEMHAHTFVDPRIGPPLYAAQGVTTVREMIYNEFALDWREQIEAGELLGPRFLIASPVMDGKPAVWGDNPVFVLKELETAAQARKAVREAKADGADFIKVYSRLEEEPLRAIAEEARKVGLRFEGHLPDRVPILNAVEAGQSSIEHSYISQFAVSSKEDEVRAILDAIEVGKHGGGHRWLLEILPADYLAATNWDSARTAETFAAIAEAGTRIVPTLATARIDDLPEEIQRPPERMKYFAQSYIDAWEADLQATFLADRTEEMNRQHRELYPYRERLVAEMHNAGVRFMTGGDTGGAPFVLPAFGVHDEMANLVAAGLTPMEAIRAATIEPARHLGMDHKQGTITKGKIADLVILDADPLDDIANTLAIHAVVVRGKLIDHQQRDKVLDDIAAVAAEIG